MNGLIYLFQVSIYLFAFYAFYSLFLSKETFFNLNRFYLIGATFASFTIPILQSEWLKNLFITEQVQEAALNFNLQTYQVLFPAQEEVKVLLLGDLLVWIYLSVVSILFIKFLYQLYRAIRAIKQNKSLNACSFFGYIAIDENVEGKEAIMVHELVHAQQLHSADVLFFELAAIVNWFNPIVYAYKRAIKNIHEYIADAVASETLPQKADYASLLFHENFRVKQQELTNSFFNQSILKQRIMMLNKNKSKRRTLWKYGFIAPLFLGMLILSSAFVSEKTAQGQQLLDKPVLTDSIPATKNLATTTTQIPLYFVDGKALNAAKAKEINPATIESVNVLKGESALKKYGDKGKDGVVEITLKKPITFSPPVVFNKTPLYILNGREITTEEQEALGSKSAQGIGSVNVLTGKAATDKYGDKGKDGVVEITLKEDQDNGIKDFASVEVMPEFPGGAVAWAQYLQSEMKYPKQAREKQISGKVIVSFTIEKTGDLTDIKVVKGISKELDEEAMRVISKSPKWIPGVNKGNAVRVAYTIPVFFQLATATK